MKAVRGIQAILRDAARRDDPQSVLACADIKAWELAEGLGSDAAVAAVGRTDWERMIPGLSARLTYKAIGWSALAAFIIVTSLSLAPSYNVLEPMMTAILFAMARLGLIAAAWSILSEMRGWEGSDAATWHAKARARAFEKRTEARRHILRDSLIAVGESRLVVYRLDDGTVSTQTFAPSDLDALTLECDPRYMALRLTTNAGSTYLKWLPRDKAFEEAVRAFTSTRCTVMSRSASTTS